MMLSIKNNWSGVIGTRHKLEDRNASCDYGPADTTLELRDAVAKAFPSFDAVIDVSSDCVFMFDPYQDLASLAKLSHSDMRYRGEDLGSRRTFNFTSPAIRNNKYSSTSDRYHTVMRTKLSGAISVANAHVSRMPIGDLVRASIQPATDALTTALQSSDQALQAAKSALGIPYTELSAAVIGVLVGAAKVADTLPIDDEHRRALMAFVAAKNSAAAPEHAMTDLRFVYYDGLEGVYHVQDVTHAGGPYHSLRPSGDPVRYTEATLPEFINDRTTVLGITKPGEFVPGVGVRLCGSVWYVVV